MRCWNRWVQTDSHYKMSSKRHAGKIGCTVISSHFTGSPFVFFSLCLCCFSIVRTSLTCQLSNKKSILFLLLVRSNLSICCKATRPTTLFSKLPGQSTLKNIFTKHILFRERTSRYILRKGNSSVDLMCSYFSYTVTVRRSGRPAAIYRSNSTYKKFVAIKYKKHVHLHYINIHSKYGWFLPFKHFKKKKSATHLCLLWQKHAILKKDMISIQAK